MKHTHFSTPRRAALLAALAAGLASSLPLRAQEPAEGPGPDALVQRLSTEVLDAIKADAALRAGDMARINALVNDKVMPHVNFRRMTAAAVGPAWRKATAGQRQSLQEAFHTLLIRTYSGALGHISDQSVRLRPLRMAAGDTDVLVRTEVHGKGEPIQLDYRLEKSADGDWKIYNLNVMGMWLVETYRSQFAQTVNASGVDGLIAALKARNAAPPEKQAPAPAGQAAPDNG